MWCRTVVSNSAAGGEQVLTIAASSSSSTNTPQLGNFGNIDYEDPVDGGLPVGVNVNFKSDFDMDQFGRSVGRAWMRWTLSEDAADVQLYNVRDENVDLWYTGAASQNNVALFFLNRKPGVLPPIGVTKITLTVSLYYRNSETVTVLMHEKIYEITLTAEGTSNTVTTSTTTGSAVTDFVVGTGTTDADGLVVTPLPEGGITFAPTSTNPVAFGSPIQVTASTTDTNYRIWRKSDVSVEIYDAATDGNLIYTWPNALVDAPTSELTTTSNTLAISLNSVPVALYNADNVFVSLGLNFRDVAGDGTTRALRVRISGEELGRNLAEFAPGSAQVETPVQMAAMESGESASSSFMVAPSAMTTTTAMAGLAFLL